MRNKIIYEEYNNINKIDLNTCYLNIINYAKSH